VGDSETIRNHAAFIWSVADLLRGDYKQSEYGKVVLPLTVIRRLDCVPEADVLARYEVLKGTGIDNPAPVLEAVSGQQFFNTNREPPIDASGSAVARRRLGPLRQVG
jgi:type I restriction enzyme M protein